MHKWEGQQVYRDAFKWSVAHGRSLPIRLIGVVETVTAGSKFAKACKFPPRPGTVIVRLLAQGNRRPTLAFQNLELSARRKWRLVPAN